MDRQTNRREEIFTKRVPAGKRVYYFDVKATKSGKDFFIVITESKRIGVGGNGEAQYEKHRIFLYKEDFEKFQDALDESVDFTQQRLKSIGVVE